MKRIFTVFFSFLLCGVFLLSNHMISDFTTAEAALTYSATVNVYDDETGELLNENLEMAIMFSADYLDDFYVNYGTWNLSETNPYTKEWGYFESGQFFEIRIHTQYTEDYCYVINTEKSDYCFDFNENMTLNLSVYLTKKDRDQFLVYRGTYGEEQYPMFEYFYSTISSSAVNKHAKVYSTNEFEEELTYGDVLIHDDDFTYTRSNAYYTFRINGDPVLTKIGNSADLFDTKTLTISGIRYYDFASEEGLIESDPRMAKTDYYGFILTDEAGTNYNYSVDYYAANSSIRLDDAKPGDTMLFALRDGYPVLPLTEPLHIPDIMGDVNEDRKFNIADIASLQKFLLSSSDTVLSDWIAADFCADEKLDVFDLCRMKQALIDEMKKPHCTLTLTTNYGGYGYSGNELESGSFTETFTVSVGDKFYETQDGHWLQNANNCYTYESRILTVESFDSDGVTFTYAEYDDEKTITVSYETDSNVMSTLYVADGINYDYILSFSDYVDLE